MEYVPAQPPVNAVAPVERRLRLWPALLIVGAMWLAIKVPGWVAPGTVAQFMFMFNAPLVAGGLFLIWWMFFSRIAWRDRFLGLGVFIVAGMLAAIACHPSTRFGLLIYGLPIVLTAWLAWLALSFVLRWPLRRWGLVLTLVVAWGYFTLLRFDGIDGSFVSDLPWRWQPTAEERFLAARQGSGKTRATEVATEALKLQPGDWPAFRGPNRDNRVSGVRVAANWDSNPPKQVWRQRVGPGWGSMCVICKHLFTQEQRGDDEVVVCYDADTGKERWVHEDKTRFTEDVAGPGPRATPTFHEGKLFTLGANGRLNCLDAATGKPLWSRNIVDDAGAKVPQWGFAASPLVHRDVVTVWAGGPDGKEVLGYTAGTGDVVWSAGDGKSSYCSTQLANIGGAEQILVTSGSGVAAFHPTEGKVLWKHAWELSEGVARVVQPAVLDNGDVLLGASFGYGTSRVKVTRNGDGWTDQEVWKTLAIKPYYNDLVVHQGHLYGFDGPFFVCVNLADGKGKWRARGYGNGQVLLLPDQNLLLVMAEKGEVALVEATPDGHKPVAKFKAIEGKTWNHPVLAHGRLYVRNGEEMACYELTLLPAEAP